VPASARNSSSGSVTSVPPVESNVVAMLSRVVVGSGASRRYVTVLRNSGGFSGAGLKENVFDPAGTRRAWNFSKSRKSDSAVLHVGYFLSLQKGYSVGDLSMVYPLARGTGPLLASAAAVALFGERPGPVAVLGILLIGGGVFVLAWEPGGTSTDASPAHKRARRLGVAYGILTGVFIAGYTLWDKQAVGGLALSPVLYYWAALAVETVILSPMALRHHARFCGRSPLPDHPYSRWFDAEGHR
jgi:multidrug transporter EmrE-like cation transporter